MCTVLSKIATNIHVVSELFILGVVVLISKCLYITIYIIVYCFLGTQLEMQHLESAFEAGTWFPDMSSPEKAGTCMFSA